VEFIVLAVVLLLSSLVAKNAVTSSRSSTKVHCNRSTKSILGVEGTEKIPGGKTVGALCVAFSDADVVGALVLAVVILVGTEGDDEEALTGDAEGALVGVVVGEAERTGDDDDGGDAGAAVGTEGFVVLVVLVLVLVVVVVVGGGADGDGAVGGDTKRNVYCEYA
jgi:hypothetical protein